MLTGEPAHALAHFWLLRPGYVVADIHVAGRHELRLLFGPASRRGQGDRQNRYRAEVEQTRHWQPVRLHDPAESHGAPITGRVAIRFKSDYQTVASSPKAPYPRRNFAGSRVRQKRRFRSALKFV